MKRARTARTGATSSESAKRAAAGILQVMGGLSTPQDVSASLGVSINRYYQLEARALQAMLVALEPRPRGPGKRPQVELERLRRDKARWEREAARNLALLRASQRTLGLVPPPPTKGSAEKRRRRRPRVRAKTVIAALAVGGAAPKDAAASPTTS